MGTSLEAEPGNTDDTQSSDVEESGHASAGVMHIQANRNHNYVHGDGREEERIRDPEDMKKHEQRMPILRLFSFADTFDYLLLFVGSIGALAHGAALPIFFLFFGKLVNGFGEFRNDPAKMATVVGQYSLDFFYLGLVVFVSAWAEVACWMHTGERQAAKMRMKYLEGILKQDVGFFDTDARTGMLVDSISSDTILVQEAIGEKMGNFLHHLATFIGGFAVSFSTQWRLALITLAVIPAIAFAGGLYAYTFTRLTSKTQEAYGEAGTIAEQAIAQIRTVYSFVGEAKAQESYSKALKVTLKLGYTGGLWKGFGLGATSGILFCAWALVLWYAGLLIRHGETDGGKAFAAIFSVILGGMSLGQAISNMTTFGKGKAAGYKIFEMINKQPKINCQVSNEQRLSYVKGNIELKNVVFSYPSRPDVIVLKDFSLEIPSGKTVAVVGSSGSGKSTVVSLLERFYDPISGQVLLDGVDIRTLQLKWLRDQTGLVNQEPALFATTIIENILYGKDNASMEEIQEAAKAANAYGFISELPEGYKTQVGARGIQLSGGQKQRVAIARAMLKNPKILLLDEATSALDAASERVVQDALDRLMVGRTTVMVAHRLSTIRNVDTIAVVQGGEIVEMGNHDELMAKGNTGAYATLVKLQELALGSECTILGRHSRHVSYQLSVPNKSDQGPPARVLSPRLSHDQLRSGSESNLEPTVPKSLRLDDMGYSTKGLYWRLVKLNAPEWPYAILGAVGSILAGLMNPLFAVTISEMLKSFYYTDLHEQKMRVQKYVIIYAGAGVAAVPIYYLQYYFFGIVGVNLTNRVRELMFKSMLQNEVSWFDLDENNSTQLAARLSTDATKVRAAIGDRISVILHNLTLFLTSFLISFLVEWRMAILVLAAFPLLLGAAFAQHLFMKGFSGDLEKAHARASMIAGEAVGNVRTVAAFNAEQKVLELLSGELRGPVKRSSRQGNVAGFFFGISQMAMYSIYGLTLWYGAVLVKNGTSDFGSVIKVFLVLMVMVFAVAETLGLAPDIVKGSTALLSVFAIIDRKSLIDADDPAADHLGAVVRGEIELRQVDFAYPSRPDVLVFRDLSLMVPAGQSLALVGASGSGKSSVISLIERFYDPCAGCVMVDGMDIRKLNLRSLRQRIGLVQQEPALFAASIYENIRYGKEGATEAEVVEAAKAANADAFISALPAGYATEAGERGIQLSGGQKQRVAIARAVLKDPAILLLDEATSALDAESEKVVQEALDRLMQGRTSVVVAHRLSTIRTASTIAVVQDGKIVEQGRHSELIQKRDGSYARLVTMQRQSSSINIGFD